MYLTDSGLVISGREAILVAIVAISIVLLGAFIRITYNKIGKANKYDDYPGSSKFEDIYQENILDTSRFSDIADRYLESVLDTERQDKVIFEEIISNVIFRYDEKTKFLTIGERFDTKSEIQPIKIKLNNGIDDLREFVDRLEDYVNE